MWEAPSFSVQIGPQKGCAEMKKSCLRPCTYTHIRSRSWRVSGRGLGRDRTAPAHLLHPDQGSAWAGVFVENDARSVPWPTPEGAFAWPDFRSMLPRKFHWCHVHRIVFYRVVMWLTSGTLRQMYDCYVIGSGPAGITLALELAKANKKVLLFESGTAIDARADMPNAINYGHLRDGSWDKP